MRAQAQFTVHTLNDVVTSKTAPENPYVGQLWVKTSVSPPTTMSWNGSAWKEANGTEEIRTSISTLTTKEATLERNLNGLTSRISLVETTVETVESNTAEAKQNILDLQSTVSEVSQTASDLSVRVTKNETDISSLSVSSICISIIRGPGLRCQGTKPRRLSVQTPGRAFCSIYSFRSASPAL